MDDISDIQREFFTEAREHLDTLNDLIIKAEAEPSNKDYLSAIFRSIHTIKGCAGFLEFSEINEFAHKFENLLSVLRDGKLDLSSEVVDLVLSASDQLNKMLDVQESGSSPEVNVDLVKQFERLCSFKDKMSDVEDEQNKDNSAVSKQDSMALGDDRIDEEGLKEFLLEAEDIISRLENALVCYEKEADSDSLNELFRVVHTIKGDMDYIGIKPLALFSHKLETVLSSLRSGERKKTSELMDLLSKSVDFILNVLKDLLRGKRKITLPDFYYLELNGDRKETCVDSSFRQEEEDKAIADDGAVKVFIQQAVQFKDVLLKNVLSADIISDDRFRQVGRALRSLKKSAGFVGIKRISPIIDEAIKAVEGKQEGILKEKVEYIITFIQGLEESPKRIGEILVEDGKILQSDVENAVVKQKPIGEILIEEGKVAKDDVDRALKKQELMKEANQVKDKVSVPHLKADNEIRTIRVEERKIEGFTSVIGELLIAKNTYEYLVDRLAAGEVGEEVEALKALKSNAHLFSRLINDMQYRIMSLRMIPIKGIFQKFVRVVRDISRKQKKNIELVMEGVETEIDKKVADVISEPMMHMVRNSCDHGIELPEERRAAGKSETGVVCLSASQEGSNLIIKIKDDGRGLDRSKIYTKAKEKGLPVSSPDADDIFDVIFMPGFSTKEVITDISGRGVGMDVVKSTLEKLGGSVHVNSELGIGTEFVLTIPVSMGVNTVLLIEDGGMFYALPIENVIETVKIPFDRLRHIHDRVIFYYRGDVIIVKSLKALLGFQEEYAVKEVSLIIARGLGKRVGIIVDRFIKNIEIAIKPVPECLACINIINGVSILGDGKVIFVLNLDALLATH